MSHGCPHLEHFKKWSVPFLALEKDAFCRQREFGYSAQSFPYFYSQVSPAIYFYSIIRGITLNESDGNIKKNLSKRKMSLQIQDFNAQEHLSARCIYLPDSVCLFHASQPPNLHILHLNIKTQLHVYEPFTLTPRVITCSNYREDTTKCRLCYLLSPSSYISKIKGNSFRWKHPLVSFGGSPPAKGGFSA